MAWIIAAVTYQPTDLHFFKNNRAQSYWNSRSIDYFRDHWGRADNRLSRQYLCSRNDSPDNCELTSLWRVKNEETRGWNLEQQEQMACWRQLEKSQSTNDRCYQTLHTDEDGDVEIAAVMGVSKSHPHDISFELLYSATNHKFIIL